LTKITAIEKNPITPNHAEIVLNDFFDMLSCFRIVSDR